MAVGHARQRPRHELETALPLLLRHVHLADVVDVEQPARHRNDQQIIRQVHAVDALWDGVRGLLGRRRPGVPESDRAIPRARNQRL